MEIESTTPTQTENAEHILKAGRHLLALINEVLDITGIEAGRLHISAEAVSVAEVVEEVVGLLGPLTSERGITLTVDYAHIADQHVHADRQRLKQVLLNLVANAVKYNRRDGSVLIGFDFSPNRRARIVVEDTGTGIATHKTARLFTPFDRLGAEGTGVEGTGLGLALSKGLVEAMGGTIGVHSVEDIGSTFWVELPSAPNPVGRLALEPLLSARKTPTGVMTRQTTILYVEDNLSNLALVQRILEARGDITLIPSMQGGLALELARSHRPDLILLDLHLPDIHGEEVLRQLRQAPDCRDIPVVVLSADATPGQVERLTFAGANAYVTKPLDVRPFIELLDRTLDARRAA